MASTIHPYSTDKGNITKGINDSISSIMSKMIQIAGRVCGEYARDIYYALCNYDNAVRENDTYDKLLLFYEGGV